MYYKQRTDVRTEELDGETVVLDDRNGYIHQLNESASFVWNQCDGKSSLTEIVRRFAENFDLEEMVASRDVSAVIEKLRDLKLLSE